MTMPAEGFQGQETTGTDTSTPETSGQGSEPEYSLASEFLSRVPENDRAVVERYVKQWDAGVTRRFQDLHSQYAPYQELGEVEDLQKAIGLIEMLNEAPERFYYALQEQLGIADGTQAGVPTEQQQPVGGGEQNQPGLPPEFVSRIDKQEEMLKSIAEYVLNLHNTQQESVEDQELEQYMQLLHDEYGDFDDDYVLTKMFHGADGDSAVKAYMNLVQQQVNAANAPASGLPPTLSSGSGGGAVPTEQIDLGKIPRNDVKSLVADILAQSQR